MFYKPFEQLDIIYATNFSKHNLKLFQNLQQLSMGHDTNVHFMHVVQEGTEQEAREKIDKHIVLATPFC